MRSPQASRFVEQTIIIAIIGHGDLWMLKAALGEGQLDGEASYRY